MYPRLLLLLLLFPLFGPGEVQGAELEDRLANLEKGFDRLAYQVMSQQLYVEETARSSSNSGVKQTRIRKVGPKSYYTQSHNGASISAIHDHANHERTAGMGEVTVVLNGVEFRTRHNDYPLKRPSKTDSSYHAVEDIPFPEVPPEVLNKASIEEQIVEMQEWFRAWKEQNYTVRDYRLYFKPVLCYLEGAWTTDQTIEEPFHSDRHQLDAYTLEQLLEQIRFTSFTANKNFKENFSFLPSTILKTVNSTIQLAQWNYRILCHEIEGPELKPSSLKPIDYLASRLSRNRSFADHVASRAARFRLDSLGDTKHWTILDDLMYQIPGKDSYNGSITDNLFEQQKRSVKDNTVLNAARYHRIYNVPAKDAMGDTNILKGWADQFLFVAQNTQPRIAEISVPFCKSKWQFRRNDCLTYAQRVSYAIPLEIIYLTPLHRWNPYRIVYKGPYTSDFAETVKADGRDGNSAEKAFNGSDSKHYFRCPVNFFSGLEVDRDSADTTRPSVFVLSENGTVYPVDSSGIRTILPHIPGVGVLRTRYPIMPVSTEGNAIWKELHAIRDTFLDMKHHLLSFPTRPPLPEQVLSVYDPSATHSYLTLKDSDGVYQNVHTHTVNLNRTQFEDLKERNQTFFVHTTRNQGHSHELLVHYNQTSSRYEIKLCDKKPGCFDQHPARMWFSRVKK